MSMYDKNHYNIVISLQLIKINEKKKKRQRDGNRLPLDTPWWDRPEVTLPHISLPLRTFWLLLSVGSPSTGWPRLWCTHLSLPFTHLCVSLGSVGANPGCTFESSGEPQTLLVPRLHPCPMKALPLKGEPTHQGVLQSPQGILIFNQDSETLP